MSTPIRKQVLQRQLNAFEQAGMYQHVVDLIRKYGHLYQLESAYDTDHDPIGHLVQTGKPVRTPLGSHRL